MFTISSSAVEERARAQKKLPLFKTETMRTAADEQNALKKEQEYIRKQLGVVSGQEEKEEEDEEEAMAAGNGSSSDIGYISEEDNKPEQRKSVSFVVDVEPPKPDSLDLEKLLEGVDQGLPNEYAVPIDARPDWLDMDKFRAGQEFAQKYYFGLNYSEMLALMLLFSFPDALKPLVFTENSSTPFTAFKRYLSTVMRVRSWFEHDVWSEGNSGYSNIKAVRAMHLNVSKRLNGSGSEEVADRLTLRGSGDRAGTGIWCPLVSKIREDFSACPFRTARPADRDAAAKVWVNQTDMSITQFGFVGLMLVFPERFGAAGATETELEGFAHLWRGLGYLLGIRDEYNFCAGTLGEVRARSRRLIEEWALPSLCEATDDWEHMSRCLVEGISWYVPGVSFEVSLYYLCWVLGVAAPRLYAALSWPKLLMFHLMRFTFHVTLRIPFALPLHNRMIRSAIRRAAALPPGRLKKLESRTYDYETGDFDTRL